MAQWTEEAVQQSVLDRLIDRDPKSRVEAPLTRAQSLRELKEALRRDLEWLLNTRRNTLETSETSQVLENSLYSYGLPDITSLSLLNSKDQNRLLRAMETAIATFEPRLMGVAVSMHPLSAGSRVLRFVIEGMLRIDPAPEHVTFDTKLEISSGQYEVERSG